MEATLSNASDVCGDSFVGVLPLGFNSQDEGPFSDSLCLGYGLYAVGNVNLLSLLYFVDYEGGKRLHKWFAGISVIFILTQFMDTSFYRLWPFYWLI